jgi:SAM-dependent methyltransferase
MTGFEKSKSLYRAMLAIDQETPSVIAFVRKSIGDRYDPVVVDIGCGYGRTLRALRESGIDGIGIDVNPEIVDSNKKDGLRCFTPAEFEAQSLQADVLIMSHVIEHFAPRDLLAFLDGYLDSLRPEGHLLIATPLLTARFFDDFDHIKPYQPLGLEMVFGGNEAQVQYYGRHRLQLADLWFRRSPYMIAYARGLYVKSWTTPLLRLVNLAGAVAFRASAGALGQASGWVGLFEKIEAPK